MNGRDDEQIAERLRAALDEQSRDIDPRIAARLAAARLRAVAAAQTDSSHFARLAPAITFACSIMFAVLILNARFERPDERPVEDVSVVDLLDDSVAATAVVIGAQDVTSEDIELIEDLDFYLWLEASGYAG